MKLYEGIFSNIEDKEKILKMQKCFIFPGRFQPFHLGHLYLFLEGQKKFKLPGIVINIISKNKKSPIPYEISQQIFNDLSKEISDFNYVNLISDVAGVAFIGNLIKGARITHNMDPMGLICGQDRKLDWQSQINNYNSKKYSNEITFTNKIELFSIERKNFGQETSGTSVRQAIKNNVFESFKNMTHKALWKYFNILQKYV